MPPLAERWERALARHRALKAEHDAHSARARAHADRAKRLLAEIEVLRARSALTPRTRLDAALRTIELSEQHGSLQERMAILLLADALSRANDALERMAG
jgi:hypothetical protein